MLLTQHIKKHCQEGSVKVGDINRSNKIMIVVVTEYIRPYEGIKFCESSHIADDDVI